MTRTHKRLPPARTAAAALLACLATAAALADDPAASPALQARLDALQHITVTEARPPAADVAGPGAEVDAALRAAAEAEATPAADSRGATADDAAAAGH